MVKGDEPFPDIYQFPDEACGNSDLSLVSISLEPKTARVMRWMNNSDWFEPSQVQTFFSIPPTMVRWNGDKPELNQSRDQFESGMQDYRFHFAKRTDYVLTIWLPKNLYIRCSAPSALIEDPGEVAFADLPQSFRDAVWRNATKNAFAVAEAMRKLQNVPRQPTITKPPPPQ
jgi:hypothetical protein